jgi:hypothetical protein
MGPLFSLGLVTLLAGLAMGVLFAISSRIFLPARAALVLAMTCRGRRPLLIQRGRQLVSGTLARFFLVWPAAASAVGVHLPALGRAARSTETKKAAPEGGLSILPVSFQ